MKRQLSYLAAIAGLLLAVQAGAQTPGFLKKHRQTPQARAAALRSSTQGRTQTLFPRLSGARIDNPEMQQAERPTIIFREYATGEKEKYECAYDSYGHITSLNFYPLEDSNYELRESCVREYHQLPSGEFAITKNEVSHYNNGEKYYAYRYTRAYDSKGMELWYQNEYYDSYSGWTVTNRREARLENGIRTAILNDGVVDDSYTFDHKGRLTRQTWAYSSDSYVYVDTISYTWNDNDRLVSAVSRGYNWEDYNHDGLQEEEETETFVYTYDNMQIVHNEKYFNPYSVELQELWADPDGGTGISAWGNFAVDDFVLHGVYYNIDGTAVENGVETSMQLRSTVEEGGNRITQAVILDNVPLMVQTLTALDGYGSYLREFEDHGNEREGRESRGVEKVIYNKYGELVEESYSFTSVEDETTVAYEYEDIYTRERNAQERPTKTSRRYSLIKNDDNRDPEQNWDETYTAWVTVSVPSTGAAEPAPSAASLRIDSKGENLLASGIDGKATLVLFTVSGQTALRRDITNGEAVSIARLPVGIYLASIQSNGKASTHKFVKK